MREVLANRRIAEIATGQHGLITTAQLVAIGLDKSAISRRVASALLHRTYRGVYAVGHMPVSREAKWKAATLSCGEGSGLSHRSAAELWRMLEPADGPIHVTVATQSGLARRKGVVIHRSRSLQSHDITIHHGIPATRPQRTLLDLRAMIEPGELRRATRQAEIRKLPIDASVIVPDRAASELELRFLALCRRYRLPLPEVNVLVAGMRVDFLWRAERLIVETDGRRFHRGVVASQDDQERDRRLTKLGYEVLRLNWHQVVHEGATTANLLRARLRERMARNSR